jgi:hypothetical protein
VRRPLLTALAVIAAFKCLSWLTAAAGVAYDSPQLVAEGLKGARLATLAAVAVSLYGLLGVGWRLIVALIPAQTLEGTVDAAVLGLARVPAPQLGEIEALRREERLAAARGLTSEA